MPKTPMPKEGKMCPECRGRGAIFDPNELTLDLCTECEGQGWIVEIYDEMLERLLLSKDDRPERADLHWVSMDAPVEVYGPGEHEGVIGFICGWTNRHPTADQSSRVTIEVVRPGEPRVIEVDGHRVRPITVEDKP